ncbi:MAG: S8 family serine peptidase, partial [Muribaculaceae bacterium]|nr:S8 family serine peptidase [Muribaculaceae bacterium]
MRIRTFLKRLLLLTVAVTALPLQAQMVSNNNVDEVYKIDKSAQWAYRPGEVIVKFKATSPVNIKSVNGQFRTSRVNAVDAVLNALGVKEAEQLMPLTGEIKNRAPRRAKALSGRVVTEPDLSLLYCLKFEQNDLTVEEAVETLKTLNEVEFAEPNYLVFIQTTDEATSYQSEPMYNLQWGLNAIKLPQLWAMDKVETERPIIAILDTGVDITHPDLTDNIWTNSSEAQGADYEDDDNNGYVDDIHGWDFVAGTPIINNGMDRNGHGTHCAGIAAAVGNNGIGITGANPDAYILPIKVMGDDGTGDITTICRGIDYAVACKAHVLSMSFGSDGVSGGLYQALTKALTNYAVLCGAAGNNGKSIYNTSLPSGLIFPGAYDIVLGVMASNSNGQLAAFSNYDPDGPFFSRYNMDKAFSIDVTWNDEVMWDYDLMAPGVGIMSTYLNGGYKMLNGTSMATPMVAGAISRILQVKGYDYARDYGLMGDMAMAKDGSYLDLAVFDATKAASYDESNREVALALTALEIDESEGDGDGRFDAGETINIWPTIRSLWGHAENIKISIEPYDDNTPTDAIEVLENNVDFGWSLNSRGSFKSKNPIRVHVNENA